MANNGSYPASLAEENQKVIGNESNKKLQSINSPPDIAVTENETNSDGGKCVLLKHKILTAHMSTVVIKFGNIIVLAYRVFLIVK